MFAVDTGVVDHDHHFRVNAAHGRRGVYALEEGTMVPLSANIATGISSRAHGPSVIVSS